MEPAGESGHHDETDTDNIFRKVTHLRLRKIRRAMEVQFIISEPFADEDGKQKRQIQMSLNRLYRMSIPKNYELAQQTNFHKDHILWLDLVKNIM